MIPGGEPWRVLFTKAAQKDARSVKAAGLQPRAEAIIQILTEDPFRAPCERLTGNLAGAYSRRINLQHRLVYEIRVEEHTVKVLRMWTQYSE